MGKAASPEFQDPTRVSQTLVALLALNLALDLAGLIASLVLSAIFAGQTADLAAADPATAIKRIQDSTARLSAIAAPFAAVRMAALLGLLLAPVWLLRVSRNAHSFNPNLRGHHAWVLYWWLVPIFNLYRPFWKLREIWGASALTPWRGELILLSCWWGGVLIWFGLSVTDVLAGSFLYADLELGFARYLAGVVATALFLAMVPRLSRRQVHMHEVTTFGEMPRPAAPQRPGAVGAAAAM